MSLDNPLNHLYQTSDINIVLYNCLLSGDLNDGNWHQVIIDNFEGYLKVIVDVDDDLTRNSFKKKNRQIYSTRPFLSGFQFEFCLIYFMPCLGGSVVSVSDSQSGGCYFDPGFRRLFFPAYFRLSPLQKHVRKEVGGFGEKSCVSTGVRKPGNTYASPTTMI